MSPVTYNLKGVTGANHIGPANASSDTSENKAHQKRSCFFFFAKSYILLDKKQTKIFVGSELFNLLKKTGIFSPLTYA